LSRDYFSLAINEKLGEADLRAELDLVLQGSQNNNQRFVPSIAHTRDGQPLSYNRAPSDDLAPWFARLYVTKVDQGENSARCGLLNDTPFVRIQLSGDWQAETADGRRNFGRAALFFGPQTRRMPLEVRGGFTSLGVAIRPGACTALKGPKIGEYLDRLTPIETVSGVDQSIIDEFSDDVSPEDWLRHLEDFLRERITAHGYAEPHPVTRSFETLSMTDPSVSIAEAAERCDVDRRQLERIVRRDFGMSPKQVLRRARALDMASQLRGVADGSEGDQMALRYYDDSHRIHEFSEFFGMSPRQFMERPQLLMTLALESRQARRLEMLKRIEPGKTRPWQ
jgi:AraC-like DNA-binding protein